jgi:hypothetical protein
MPPPDESDLKSFTSRKLDWLRAICCDPIRVSDKACRLATYIAFRLNQQSGMTWFSDETLADDVPTFKRTKAWRARSELIDAGYLRVARRNRVEANQYYMVEDKVAPVLHGLAARAGKRKEDRIKRRDEEFAEFMRINGPF